MRQLHGRDAGPGRCGMTLADRTAHLLSLHDSVTWRSLILASARSDGLESGELRRLPPRWWLIGRYELECAEWEATVPRLDADPVVVEPRDSLLALEQSWAVNG